MRISKILTGMLAIMVLVVFVLPSCKRYEDVPPYFEPQGDTTKPAARKILIIGIDGAVGSEYKAIQAPVLEGMKAHSKYTWEAVSDEVTTDAASWKTLMTGISYGRHTISDSTFIYTQPAGAGEHDVITSYPSFFNYILSSSKPDLKTVFISPWSTLLDRLVPEVESKVLVQSDQAAKDSAVARLKNTNADLMVVHFNSPAVAGRADEFSASSVTYKDAVLQVDGYMGEIMTALKSRPEYNKSEEWLVIVTGTHGGNGNSYGGPSEKETNVFSFYYNENMKETELIKGGAFSGVQLKGRDESTIKAQVLDDGGLYNPGTGEQTVQIRVKGTAGYYPHFFSKMEKWPSTPGWSMFSAGGNWAISVRSTTSGERRIQGTAPTVLDNQWHTITIVFADSASKKWLRRYSDGKRFSQDDITSLYSNGGTIASSSPLTLGWQADPGMPAVTFYTADAMIFNTALTDDEITQTQCLSDISQHAKYSNLIGYWPGNDGFGSRFRNMAPGKNFHFILSGPFQWENLEDLPCSTSAVSSDPKVKSLFVKNVDVVTTALYWLRIPTKTTWGLEGSTWLQQYEVEFVKL
ncbi:MAG: LamG-like jellyroll fold domain-containing protein [Flavisolibacter sp.]